MGGFATGETKEELESSPFAEQLLEKGYEVIYFTDPVDEYVMQNLLEYEDFKFQSASKEDLKLGDKDAKKENKKLRVAAECPECLSARLWELLVSWPSLHTPVGEPGARTGIKAVS